MLRAVQAVRLERVLEQVARERVVRLEPQRLVVVLDREPELALQMVRVPEARKGVVVVGNEAERLRVHLDRIGILLLAAVRVAEVDERRLPRGREAVREDNERTAKPRNRHVILLLQVEQHAELVAHEGVALAEVVRLRTGTLLVSTLLLTLSC